ncbi:uncharacterized protein LOC116805038 [Drosophila grimshawi]|uniref:uncharacterized protein LOC116805038 n=1 Tax=Drosophila grimshawi TaxID=7222 RepID=UPI000C871308|nr:uncharacterized protein LOC116805038 [Drosophila grimshawi]
MLIECQGKYARMAVAVLSTIVSIGVIAVIEVSHHQQKKDLQIMNHICLLQIICSVLLFVGSLKYNKWFFLPWLAIAIVFAYALVYRSIAIWINILNDLKQSLIIISLLYTIAGFWCYFIYAIIVDFHQQYVYNQIHGIRDPKSKNYNVTTLL